MPKRISKKDLGIKENVLKSFDLIFKNWKLFLPLLLIDVLVDLALVGVSMDVLLIMNIFLFLMTWLVVLFFARQIMAARKVRFSDGLYNAMTPLVSTLLILVLALIQCVPLFFLIIVYATAIETHFFTNFGYILMFGLFACVMIAISSFLLSDTMVALMAVSAPGMYPWRALQLASGLMKGKRARFVVRLLVLGMILMLMWGVAFLPVALLALVIQLPTMLVPIMMLVLGSFSIMFMAVYLYIYYRSIIGYDEKRSVK